MLQRAGTRVPQALREFVCSLGEGNR